VSTGPTPPSHGVLGLDHLVLRTSSVEGLLDFYAGKLGLGVERYEAWKAGEVPFPSVRINATTIIDLLEVPPGAVGPPGAGALEHLCLVVTPELLAAVTTRTPPFDTVTVVDGPGVRWGAQGDAVSVYVPDPDGNVVELRCYR